MLITDEDRALMRKAVKRSLEDSIDRLNKILNTDEDQLIFGLCSEVVSARFGATKKLGLGVLQMHRVDKQVEKVLRHAFTTWKKFSGDIVYPVPAPTGYKLSPLAAYHGLPRWKGEYGRLRKKLVVHVIKSFKKELDKYKDV